jgi:chitinase
MKYIKKMKLAGGMVWDTSMDDFRNLCGDGKNPFLTTMRKYLSPSDDDENDKDDDKSDENDDEKDENDGNDDGDDDNENDDSSDNDDSDQDDDSSDQNTYGDKDVVCYFINWAWYRTGNGKYSADDVDPTLCTIINYAFAVLENNKIKIHDPWADTTVGGGEFFKKIVALKSKPGSRVRKVLLAIGGWNDSKGSKYSDLAKSPQLRYLFLFILYCRYLIFRPMKSELTTYRPCTQTILTVNQFNEYWPLTRKYSIIFKS